MPEESLIYWLWIVQVMGIAHKETPFLTEKFPDIREMYEQMLNPDCDFMKEHQKKRARQITLKKSEEMLMLCRKQEINIMTWNSEAYPERLRNIYNPPAILFYRGNPACLKNEKLLTAVGTRYPSEYSQFAAERLYHELARSGYMLVSGCAVGLDTAAHRAAIQNEKPTIAVLGCGIDRNYPTGSRELKEKITENGLLLTEYFPGTPPYGTNFPVRNRILIGISKALLVTEAGIDSGCMVTANLACEQGKSVFCIPPADIYAGRYAGQVKLLREGAFPVYGAQEVIQEMEHSKKKPEEKHLPKRKLRKKSRKSKPVDAEPVQPSAGAQNTEWNSLSEEEQIIIRSLSESQKNLNMLCCVTGMKFEAISIHLVELEMLGWISSSDGIFYRVTEKYQPGA